MLKAVQAWPANSAEHSAAESPSDFCFGPAMGRSGGVGSRMLYTKASPAMPADPTLSHRHPTACGGHDNKFGMQMATEDTGRVGGVERTSVVKEADDETTCGVPR